MSGSENVYMPISGCCQKKLKIILCVKLFIACNNYIFHLYFVFY